MEKELEMIKGKFPAKFMWGTATASYQVEGGWNADGKGPSVWDTFAHNKEKIEDQLDADIACDSYHKYKEDVQMLKNLKVNCYRFSLSWSRLLPSADASKSNPAGVKYYNNLINELLSAGIQPCVTLYHWDLPQCLQDKGGWQDDRIIGKFEEYARFCFDKFGDRVKTWITINEPHVNCAYGFASGIHAPGIQNPMFACYQVSRTMLLSHAKAWRLYDGSYRKLQGGRIAISLNSDWCEPKDPSNPEHQKAASAYITSTLGWFAHPIYVNGDYPKMMKEMIAANNKKFGIEQDRLPVMTAEEKALILGTHDFFGINHYTSRLAEPITEENKKYQLHPDLNAFVFPNPQWERAGSEWLYIVPWGLRRLLKHIKDTYGNPSIIITENGCSSKHPPSSNPADKVNIDDRQRCNYHKAYLNEALKAHKLDGVDLQGYFAWSLMDNFEWAAGYTERFGLYHVDFDDVNRRRKPRKSAQAYREIIEKNGFD